MSTLYENGFGAGIPLGSSFVPGSPTQGTANINMIAGFHGSVPTYDDLLAIPIDADEGLKLDGITSGRRQVGMIVTVVGENPDGFTGIRYQLSIPNYASLPNDNEKLDALSNNENWKEYTASGGDGAAGADLYNVPASIRSAVVAGVFNDSGELQATVEGSVAGMRFSYKNGQYEYMPGDAGNLVWIRNKKAGIIRLGTSGGSGAGSGSGLPTPKIETVSYRVNDVPDYPISPIATVRYLRFSFSESVDHLADKNPEIWLFHYKRRSKKKVTDDGDTVRVKKSSWIHPVHSVGDRHSGSFFSGYQQNQSVIRNTEFFGVDVVNSIANNGKVKVEIDGTEWFEDLNDGTRPVAYGRKGNKQRFRFALVIDDVTTKSGKRISELSDEITLFAEKIKNYDVDKYIYTFMPSQQSWRHD